jgi:two-component system, NarL family, sensor kinase
VMRSPIPRIEFDRVLNRSIVYATLTGGIIVTYAVSVMLLRGLFPGDGPYAVALLSTGAAALVALPLRDRLQRAANRLMYGDRDEPYRAIARLGEHLEASLDADDVLPTVVATVAEALRLPYVAVELDDGGAGPSIAAEHGRRPGRSDDLLRLPLVHGGVTIGSLLLAPRSPREGFSDADLHLLAGLGRQAGPAVHSVRLTADLRRSREYLVTAREEERRRLQRDLHDGVGPTLAGTLMKMEAARARLAEHPEEAERMLAELAGDTRRIIDEVRRVTYDLRPPALDQLGLADALREQATGFVGASERPLQIRLEAESPLPPISAAVEVAAYRIGVEALTNVARHSGARTAVLRLVGGPRTFVVEVEDDGCGLREDAHAGVGHRSMRERAEELGGSISIGAGPAGGTRIRAVLPIRNDA